MSKLTHFNPLNDTSNYVYTCTTRFSILSTISRMEAVKLRNICTQQPTRRHIKKKYHSGGLEFYTT